MFMKSNYVAAHYRGDRAEPGFAQGACLKLEMLCIVVNEKHGKDRV